MTDDRTAVTGGTKTHSARGLLGYSGGARGDGSALALSLRLSLNTGGERSNGSTGLPGGGADLC